MSLIVRDVIARAMRLNGALAAGDEANADDTADILTAFNTMKAAWFGSLIGARMTEQAASGTSAQAENGGEYGAPALAGFALTAPAAPRSGAMFGVVDSLLNFATNNCTIIPGGRLIEGAAASLVLSTNGDNRRWWYRGDTGNWVREAPFATVGDAIEFPDTLIAYMPYMLAMVIAAEFGTDLRADVIAGNAEGRAAFARAYAPGGRNPVETPVGLPVAQPQPQAAG